MSKCRLSRQGIVRVSWALKRRGSPARCSHAGAHFHGVGDEPDAGGGTEDHGGEQGDEADHGITTIAVQPAGNVVRDEYAVDVPDDDADDLQIPELVGSNRPFDSSTEHTQKRSQDL